VVLVKLIGHSAFALANAKSSSIPPAPRSLNLTARNCVSSRHGRAHDGNWFVCRHGLHEVVEKSDYICEYCEKGWVKYEEEKRREEQRKGGGDDGDAQIELCTASRHGHMS
jgi:hypothetical protein